MDFESVQALRCLIDEDRKGRILGPPQTFKLGEFEFDNNKNLFRRVSSQF